MENDIYTLQVLKYSSAVSPSVIRVWGKFLTAELESQKIWSGKRVCETLFLVLTRVIILKRRVGRISAGGAY